MSTTLFAGASDVGGRSENQDRWIAKGTLKAAGSAYAVVADGMGGHPDGERCADLVIRSAAEYLSLAGHRPNRARIARYIIGLPAYVQRQLAHAATDGALHPDSGATLGAVLVQDDVAWLVAVGDTRCMVVRNGTVFETTVPHNRLALALRDGEAVPSPLARQDLGSAVTRYMSPKIPLGAEPVIAVPVEPGDDVLVTSDGVHEPLGLPEVARTTQALHGLPVARTPQALVDRSLSAAGPGADNATAVLMRIGAI